MDESVKSPMAKPPFRSTHIKNATKFGVADVSRLVRAEKARKAAETKSTPVKISTNKDIGYKVVDVGPGQKETVRKQHNWKEEVEQVEEMGQPSTAERLSKMKLTHSLKHKVGAHSLGDRAARTRAIKTGMTDRNEEVEQVDEKMSDDQKKAVKSALDYRKDIGMKSSTSDAKKIIKFVKNEEVDLDEGRGRPPKEGSKAWHAKQASMKSGEGEEQEADKNIVNQMRKKPVGDHHSLTFNNGEKKQVHVQHVNKALSMLANTPKPADREKLQNSLSHSHDRFMNTIKSGKAEEDKPRSRVSLGSMKREEVEMNEATMNTTDNRGSLEVRRVRKADGSYELAVSKKGKITKESLDKFFGKVLEKLPESSVKDDRISEILNNLYADLSEENKEIFEDLIQTEQGLNDLLDFAEAQGY